MGAGRRRAGQPLAGHRAVQAEAAAAGVSGLEKVLLVAHGGRIPRLWAVSRGVWAPGAAVSRSEDRLRTRQWRAATHQALYVAAQTATQATGISGMWEVCSVGVFFPAKGAALAVIPAAGARQRVTTGGAGAGTGLAVSLASLTQALLAGVSRMREAVPIYKHLCLQDAVWAAGPWRQEPKQRLRV